MIAAGRPAHHRDSSDVQFVGSTGAQLVPRICMFRPPGTLREKAFPMRTLYEAQDVLCDTENVDVIVLEPGRGFRLRERSAQKAGVSRYFRQIRLRQSGAMGKFRMAQTYDLFISRLPESLGPALSQRDRGLAGNGVKTSICWIDEMWAATLPAYETLASGAETVRPSFCRVPGQCRTNVRSDRPHLHMASGRGRYAAVQPLSMSGSARGRRLQHRPAVLQKFTMFCWRQHPGKRSSMSTIHVTLQVRRFTTTANIVTAIANMAKRSRTFLVAPGKVDDPSLTGGQVEVGYRYFEGAAAGAVLIGQAPKGTAFDQAFPWPDAVIPVKHDGSDIRDVLSGLNADAQRLSAHQPEKLGAEPVTPRLGVSVGADV